MSSITSAALRAKQTGILNISQRDLVVFPHELVEVDNIKFGENARWWEFVPITKFDASFNNFAALPCSLFSNNNLLDLVVLSFAHNRISEIPHSVTNLSLLKSLNFANNKLVNVPNLAGLRSLVELRLTANLLTTVPEGLDQLSNLQALYLDSNNLDKIDGCFVDSLRLLEMSSNKILSCCADFLSPNSAIQNLGLSKNSLKSLPPCVGRLPKLVSLDVSQNLLQTLPDLKGLFKLDTLLCSNNKLASLPEELPATLTNLAADNNKLFEFPTSLLNLPLLVTLDLRNNDIRRVDPEFARGRKCLLRFYLDGNPVREIPFNVLKTGAVAILNHLRKKIEDIDDPVDSGKNVPTDVIASCKSLTAPATVGALDSCAKQYSINNQPIDFLPQEMTDGSLVNLRKVDVCKALISVIPDLKLPNVTSFRIAGCRLTSVSLRSFSGLPILEELKLPMNRLQNFTISGEEQLLNVLTLDLEDNQLDSLSEAVMHACPKLQNLMLMNNNIHRISADFGAWKSLRTLTLSGNPLKAIPQSTILKGTEAVKKLLRERLGGELN